MHKKQLYAAPATEVLELKLETNVLISSPTSPTLGNGGLDNATDEGDYVWQ